MNIYPEQSSVPLSVSFLDSAGQMVQPVHLNIILKDGDEDVLMVLYDGAPAAGATSHDVIIPEAMNASEADGELTPRMVAIRMDLADGRMIRKSVIYGIEPLEKLAVCVNSFQTLPRAIVEASQIVNATAFNEESPARQAAALIEAYDRIVNLPMTYSIKLGQQISHHRLTNESWEEMSAETFDTQLPTRLRRALRQAQIVEADEILQGNILARKHASGIQSETIGESSVTLRAGTFGHAGLSSFTKQILAPFLDTTIRIGRA